MSRSSSRSSVHNELFSFPARTSSNISVTGDTNASASDLASTSNFAQSLLSARRPSWTPSLSFRDLPSEGTSTLSVHTEDVELTFQPSSPEDGGNFRRSLQIDNKGLVGDAVGNVSICYVWLHGCSKDFCAFGTLVRPDLMGPQRYPLSWVWSNCSHNMRWFLETDL
jgi:hypothetical protein